jgi:hypothetical protein
MADRPTQSAWFERVDGNGRIDLVWPSGFVVRFIPQPVLFDPAGRVVAEERDVLTRLGGAFVPGVGHLVCSVGGTYY